MHKQTLNIITFFCTDECLNVSLSGCSDICTNTDGSFVCECNTGYQLDDDMMTCSGMLTTYICLYMHTLAQTISICIYINSYIFIHNYVQSNIYIYVHNTSIFASISMQFQWYLLFIFVLSYDGLSLECICDEFCKWMPRSFSNIGDWTICVLNHYL